MKRQIFALLALLSAFVSASPGSFEVPIHRRAGTRSLASLQAGLASTRTKYGFRKALDRRRAVGTVAMVDYAADTMYLTSISIGGTTLEVMMDTGSADLVVATLSCSSCDSTAARYDSTSSPSAVVSATNFSITYGTGSASGVLVQDIVAMGGFSVASQTFAACDVFATILQGSQSGLLGLGWQSIATSGAMPFVQGLYEAGSLTSPVFGMAFATWSDNVGASLSTLEPGGYMTIGGVNPTLYTGALNYIPLVASTYWSVPLDDVLVNGVSVGVSSTNAIIDTGTTLVSMPAASVTSIYAAISSESSAFDQFMRYPCSVNVTLSLSFGGIYYDIPSENFAYAEADTEGKSCYGSVYDASGGTSTTLFIIGQAFLKGVYSAYQFDPPAVGFATLADVSNILEGGTAPSTTDSTFGAPVSTTEARETLSSTSESDRGLSFGVSLVLVTGAVMSILL